MLDIVLIQARQNQTSMALQACAWDWQRRQQELRFVIGPGKTDILEYYGARLHHSIAVVLQRTGDSAHPLARFGDEMY
jgi:hypothetical protein